MPGTAQSDRALGPRRAEAPAASLRAIVEQVRAAAADGAALRIVGGDTKAFYGRATSGAVLSTAAHAGVVSHEPTELVITARAGTPLDEVERVLAGHGQVLGFEPPRFGAASTIGGVVSAGLSGPARPWRGSARDYVLGVELLNGRGEVLRFGGEVMKNVAGFDVSRLATGALGTLGVLTEVSLRVVPRPERETTLSWNEPRAQACERMLAIARAPWPVTGMAYDGEALRVRVGGSAEAVDDAAARLEPEAQDADPGFWQALRDLDLPPLAAPPLWRVSVPPAAPETDLAPTVVDWGGAQRWFAGPADPGALVAHARACGGHALCFRGTSGQGVFAEPDPALRALFERLKRAFDPNGVFNPGRLYDWL